VTTGLLVTLALQSAVGPFATDMYSPSFPQVAEGLGVSASLVGLTLTSFFIGMGLGQVVGGAISDQTGRRRPLLVGGLVCTLGAVGCVLAPSLGWLVAARFFQGLGGGAAAVIARAVAVDRARGDQLAKVLTLLGAIGGFAPMIAPVLGGVIASVAPWRVVFWCLVGLGLAMTASAWAVVRESLPPAHRHTGGLASMLGGAGSVLKIRPFVGYLVLNCWSGAALFAYITDSSYVLQGIAGLTPLAFSLVFAGNALVNMVLSFVNSSLVGRYRPRTLIRWGLSVSATGVLVLAISVFLLGTPLVPTCAGFTLLLGGQAFVFGNSNALSLSHARAFAGTAAAVSGFISSLVNSAVAPVASLGGTTTAYPMVIVMLVGSAGAWATFGIAGRWSHPE
jgi:DHA1 family bicyclomycin/chloramphenicol resistance-like MFS transporter